MLFVEGMFQQSNLDKSAKVCCVCTGCYTIVHQYGSSTSCVSESSAALSINAAATDLTIVSTYAIAPCPVSPQANVLMTGSII